MLWGKNIVKLSAVKISKKRGGGGGTVKSTQRVNKRQWRD